MSCLRTSFWPKTLVPIVHHSWHMTGMTFTGSGLYIPALVYAMISSVFVLLAIYCFASSIIGDKQRAA